jgi:hypothetical protein
MHISNHFNSSTMKKIRILLMAVLATFSMYAQDNAPTTAELSAEPRLAVDLSLASSLSSNALALSINRLHPIAFKKRFSIGYGARFTGFYGQDNGYVTAPAEISEGNFLKLQNEEKLDTLYMSHASVGMLNLAIFLDFKITKRLSAQFNIDAVGFSFGASRTGRFEALSQEYSISEEDASVTTANWLFTGDYDHGSLNSEMTINYLITERLLIRPGVSFLFTEFTTKNKLAFDNDRFRNKTLMPMLAITLVL